MHFIIETTSDHPKEGRQTSSRRTRHRHIDLGRLYRRFDPIGNRLHIRLWLQAALHTGLDAER